MPGPLEGFRVVDFGTYAVGPSASAYMAYLGAEVIRIENPAGEGFMELDPTMDGMASSYINANMQKKSIVLDLREPEELETARQITDVADVFIENRIPGVADKLGMGYEDLSSRNPALIYISMPGFARSGPLAGRPSMDMEVQAWSGFASVQGAPGAPGELFRVYAHLDHSTGLMLVQAAILALLERRKTGEGRQLTVGFFSTSMLLQLTRIAEFQATGRDPERLGSASTLIAPSQSFPCMDNIYINISAPDEHTWERLCHALGIGNLVDDERFKTNDLRVKNREKLGELISRRTVDAASWWWLRVLRQARVPCGLLYTFQDIERDTHFREEDIVAEIQTNWGRILRGGHPWHFSKSPSGPVEPTHIPGSDREEVLKVLKKRLAAKGAAS